MKKDVTKNFLLYIRYPYTAGIIAIMWISMAIILIKQKGNNLELFVILTSFCTLYIAYRGFKTLK